MDWAKAKNILLLIFFVLNAFLVFNLRTFYFGESVSQKTISDAVKILNNSGVVVKCDIPRKSVDMWKLKYDLDEEHEVWAKIFSRMLETKVDPNEVKLDAELTNRNKKVVVRNERTFAFTDEKPAASIDITDKNDVLSHARKFYFKIGLPFKSNHLDSYIKNPDGSVTVIFIEKFKDYFVYDNYLNITITRDGIIGAVCSYKKTGSMEKDKLSGKKFIDAYLMLIKNFDGAKDITITGIDLGFKKSSSKSDIDVISLSPYWRVRLDNGEEHYFNASDGEKE